MISANVSGRGTPNISESGRDTPLSQAESGDREAPPHPQPALPETVQKKNREDVTDKFGKFEIKQELDCKYFITSELFSFYSLIYEQRKLNFLQIVKETILTGYTVFYFARSIF